MRKTVIFKLFLIVINCLLVFTNSIAQEKVYLSTKESLETRPTPEWFGNAKLGIFIHWGLYSVPAWATPTTTPDKVTDWPAFYKSNPYAEWYLNSLRINGSPTQVHHEKVYGKSYDYYSFKDTLLQKTVNWNADSWTELFAKIGAKYVVFTTKHMDGYTMYPSSVTNPYFSKDKINSPRDFTGELCQSVRAKGMKFGVYYSGGLDLTFNHSPITNLWPDLFQSMPKSVAYTAYADCQAHELIHRYKPDVFWNDIDYPKNGDVLGIFSELFNVNPNAVVNDRWQQYPEMYNFTTPEYQVMDSIVTKKWEICRGIGYSFGYNQVEGDEHLLSSEALIQLLIDVVSKNGNLLLDVGPKADGSIPENQLKRLTDLGNWMQVNGEGIYNTRPWLIPSSKLSDGTRICYTSLNNSLYVFILNQPTVNTITVPIAAIGKNATAELFYMGKQNLNIKRNNSNIEITLPPNVKFDMPVMIKLNNVLSKN